MAEDDTSNRILVVDDQEEILELLGEYLKARGYAVVTAYDGRDALEVVRTGRVDLVLTDLMMPHMDGLQLLGEIAKLSHPVGTIVMSGFGTVETAIRAMKEGAYDYILKPFKLRDIYASLVRASDRLALERDARRMRELLAFYEMGFLEVDREELSRLFGALASVARVETGAEEVAVWMRGPGGWEAVARGGEVKSLARFDPSSVSAPTVRDEAIASVPIFKGETRVGTLAVAGGDARVPAHLERLALLARVTGEALNRVGYQPTGG